MLSFCGIEIATVHADEVDNPQHAFPRALAYSVVIILLTLLLGSMAIAVVLPKNEISLVAGIMQSFDAFFRHYHTSWLMPFVAIMLVLGGLGGVNNWIIAPTAGLMVAGKDHNLPGFFLKKNKHGAPVTLLVTQALIVTVLSFLFIFMPSVNGSYWYLTALAAQLYMLMYCLMLLAAIVLRYRHPKHPASFRIPGGIGGVIGVCGAGIAGVVVTFIVSFMPPNDIDVGNIAHYVMALVTGLVLMCAPPFLSYGWMNRRGRMG
jgi:amino acid transporter